MVFNSLQYIFLFLPIVAIVNYCICKLSKKASRLFITMISAWFYYEVADANVIWLSISCLITFSCYKLITANIKPFVCAIIGITFNVAMLCFFKYKYLLPTLTGIEKTAFIDLLTPVAISFFVFQQISFIVDVYKNKISKISLLNYLYYVLFFPKMVAGPITRFDRLIYGSTDTTTTYRLLAGFMIFSVGLYKKVVLSSIFAQIADVGYAAQTPLSMIDAWMTSLSYTMQIYYDFSGYSDMAIGSALILGISLPANFNSPYKAVNIRDFWSRWHISLSTWLRDYVYIPLGGSRKGYPATLVNLLITFTISGAWHGATINFILWGLLHGLATIINTSWSKLGFSMPKALGLLLTFLFINFSWVPFRAQTLDKAISVYQSMLGLHAYGIINWWPVSMTTVPMHNYDVYKEIIAWGIRSSASILILAVCIALALTAKNSNEMACHETPNPIVRLRYAVLCGLLAAISVICLFGGSGTSTFIYANF
ncbi:MBOAT family O-acyltransferase [Enterobacter sp.]|uniref:MBOAT family O-acyltransferase n=1 Tax=Enterobacter sp. TaxID=42895 RepID=UPI00296EA948|nr:MBOAT family O-acyltransferase [Enterobacter sp.]